VQDVGHLAFAVSFAFARGHLGQCVKLAQVLVFLWPQP
jgi:hypothetical protein